LGLSNFEQFIEESTDTVVYSFNKLVGLLSNCNPNIIEMLGCKPGQYVIVNPIGQEIINNRKMFLSRKAINSFGGYANHQLRRLQNAVARDALNQSEKEHHMLISIKNSMLTFNDKYEKFDEGAIRIYIDESNKTDMDTEIFMDIKLKGYPLRDYKSMWSEMNEVVKVYGKLNHRNNKKDENHLNKHACHLIRLYLMALDIFEKEEIITYRENDLPLLMAIRNGKYMNEDGTYHGSFFELVDDYEKRLEYAKKNSDLPVKPDYKAIEEFVMYVNEKVVRGDC
jgi:predicted nucleotidyltransferase